MADEKATAEQPANQPASRNWLEYIRGSYLKYVLIAILPSLVFAMVYLYVDLCFAIIILPFMAVILIWLFKVTKLLHQVILGAAALAVASVLISAIMMMMFVGEPQAATGDFSDGSSLDGTVTPFRGAVGAEYNFTLAVDHPGTTVDARLVIVDVYFAEPKNISMTLISVTNNNTMREYYSEVTVNNSINYYYFDVQIDGVWHNTNAPLGPVSIDSLSVYVTLAGIYLVEIFAYSFMQFIVMLVFLRMSAKSKDARQKMLVDYKKKKEISLGKPDEEKGGPAADAKSDGKEDSFVCSECGSEVKATAKYCPNCGEPFDEEEDDKSGSENEKK